MNDFEAAINKLDMQLFEKISSQSTDHDKQSLLACQLAVRGLVGQYNYLEIGSYLGGSIQPHLLDPCCGNIYSIDKRPKSQPDARGYDWVYQNNSTERMIDLLKSVAEDTEKVTTFDGDTRSIGPENITEKVQLCFIDGEHTDDAVFSDFEFCLRALDRAGAIIFHDAQITYNGIDACLKHLEKLGIAFRAYILSDAVFVVQVGDFPIHKHEMIAEKLTNNFEGYLYALKDNDHYRRFATRFPFGTLRRLRLKILGGNVSD